MVSSDNEIENTLIYTKYKPLNRSGRWLGKLVLFAVNSFDGSDVRISKRSVVPGSRLRGFEKGKSDQ